MARYLILKSPANEVILSMLNIPYETYDYGIVFDFELNRENLLTLARTIRLLGYAHSDEYALRLAQSFFLNKLSE